MSHKIRSSDLGNPEAGPFSASEVERFWAKVGRKSDAECWPWRASCWGSGYGQFRIQRPGGDGRQQTWGAHRAAFTLSHGPIPDGASVLHHCDNPLCCNPAHLYAGTHADNMADAAERGRLHVPRPKRQRVPDAVVEQILMLVRSGMPKTVVADMHGVSKTFVSLLVAGKRRQYRPSLQQQRAS